MKKVILLSLFIVITTIASSQNWQTVNTKRLSYFLSENEFYGLKADSVLVKGTDTIYYPYSYFNYNRSLTSPSYDTSWAGHKIIIQKNGYDLYFNSNNDTIVFNTQAKINDIWVFYKTANGDYFEATIHSKEYVDLGGKNDSIKTISLQYKNSVGTEISHPFNKYKFRISKNYGIVQTSGLLNFPENKDTLTLIGIDSIFGTTNIKIKEIFDFKPGDIFHYKQDNYFSLHSFYKDSILSKTYSIKNDSVIYKIYRYTILTKEQYPSFVPYKQYSDTIISKYPFNISTNYDYIKLNTPPKCWYFYSLPNTGSAAHETYRTHTYYEPSVHNRITRTFYWNSNFEGWDTSAYGAGIGMIYRHYNQADYVDNILQLVYYKKGNEIWGTPVDFNSLTVLNNLAPSGEATITISPNPFSEQASLLITNSSYNNFELSLIDLAGNTVQRCSGITNNITTIHKDNLYPGIYILKITGDNGSIGYRKLIIH